MLGHTIDRNSDRLERLKGVNVEDLLSVLGGKGFANSAQAELMARGGQATQIGRLAGSKLCKHCTSICAWSISSGSSIRSSRYCCW